MTARNNRQSQGKARGTPDKAAMTLQERELAALRALTKTTKAVQKEARQRALEQREKDHAQRIAEVHAEEARRGPTEPLGPVRYTFPSLYFSAGRKRR